MKLSEDVKTGLSVTVFMVGIGLAIPFFAFMGRIAVDICTKWKGF